jgi:hypothetical protein
MKIQLKKDCVAVLSEESGETVAVFGSLEHADPHMEDAVRRHFDTDCTLVDPRDFNQPFDYDQPYKFRMYNEEDNYITLRMTYAPLYPL